MGKTWLAVGACACALLVACGGDDTDGSGGAGGSGSAGEGGGAGQGGAGEGGGGGAGGEASLLELYHAAVADAEVAEESERVDTLTAIDDENANLVRDAEDRVLMLTWTSYAGYDELVGEETELGVEVWSTAAPELQAFCRASGLEGAALSLRLEQLLGLPPDSGKDRVVALWVPAESMFRPTPDLEIDDTTADLDFPEGTPQEHEDWFNALKATSYGEDGYPWTRLGYTYDWSPEGQEVGLSEFVIRKGTTVVVESVTPQDEYCRPAQ
ncbi:MULTISPECIES: hypothetical protein [Sorangium]|uniref:Uncharacterized protein n=1 Tax=Sorangium cellulosum TaxID=56 RepID=A0A4P2R1K5_SORCE|nr:MULTISPECIES: hypothetical protein [Sorangium]AUX36745.1 uncharacterized protein SOCE836_089600 [Sorangium cellulosum]WCQ96043.1 hypothetical protein NQZ70_08826 [Sorangium sp. Soce836]